MLKAAPRFIAHSQKELLRCQKLWSPTMTLAAKRLLWSATERLLLDLTARAEVICPLQQATSRDLWSVTLRTASFARFLHKDFKLYSLTDKTFARQVRRLVMLRDNYRCVYCSATEHLTLDHVEPKSMGGSSAIGNLVTACARCNLEKADGPAWFPGAA